MTSNIKQNLALKSFRPFGVRHSCSFYSALFRVVLRGITCFENWIWWCLYKDAVAELLDGSEGDGRANGCEIADSVDVGVLGEFPNFSKGGVNLLWWFIPLKWEYLGSIVSEKRNLTSFLRFSLIGISLKPCRINICMIPAATAIEWLSCPGNAYFRTRSSASNVVPSTISETSLIIVRYLFANSFPAVLFKNLASTNFRSLSDAIELIPQYFSWSSKVVSVVSFICMSFRTRRFARRVPYRFCRHSCRFCLSESFQVQ